MGSLADIKASLGNAPSLPQMSPHDAICFRLPLHRHDRTPCSRWSEDTCCPCLFWTSSLPNMASVMQEILSHTHSPCGPGRFRENRRQRHVIVKEYSCAELTNSYRLVILWNNFRNVPFAAFSGLEAILGQQSGSLWGVNSNELLLACNGPGDYKVGTR